MIFVCQEGRKIVEHDVRLFIPRIEDVVVLVDKIQTVPNFLSRSNPYDIFLKPENSFLLVGEVGVIGVVDPVPESYAHVHITFWDRRLRGRHTMCREIADMILELGRYRFLFTAIPVESKKVLTFARKIGFVPIAHKDGAVGLRLTGRRYGR